MAAPTGVACAESLSCVIHISDKFSGSITRFTEASWAKVRECAQKWLVLDGPQQKVAEQRRDLFEKDLNNLDPTFGYHRVCYSRFTDKTRVERAEARKKRLAEAHIPEPQEQSGPELSPPTPSPKKRLRSHHAA